jgi:hypothetical protein
VGDGVSSIAINCLFRKLVDLLVCKAIRRY